MMKNRFFKFIRVYWKGILLYAIAAGPRDLSDHLYVFWRDQFLWHGRFLPQEHDGPNGHLYGGLSGHQRCPGLFFPISICIS